LIFCEVLAAFFLEACFLGIMLFGMKKVGPRLHFFATCAVAIGSLFSAFWILSANSWMHTPAGYAIGADGRFIARDCWAIIFNPSFPYRLAHMTLAAFPGLATLLAGVSAWQLLRADSLYLRHDLSSTIAALDEFPPQDIPPVPTVFFAFRVMVGLGLLMLGQGVASLVLRWRHRLYATRWMYKWSVGMTPAGFLAMLSGWTVTEVGRQPFTVYGLLRTADSLSAVSRAQVVGATWTILAFYLVIFGVGLWVLLRVLREPPHEGEPGPQPTLADETGES
jgi:cytochrome bd-type quinol oxidase subunit 1